MSSADDFKRGSADIRAAGTERMGHQRPSLDRRKGRDPTQHLHEREHPALRYAGIDLRRPEDLTPREKLQHGRDELSTTVVGVRADAKQIPPRRARIRFEHRHQRVERIHARSTCGYYEFRRCTVTPQPPRDEFDDRGLSDHIPCGEPELAYGLRAIREAIIWADQIERVTGKQHREHGVGASLARPPEQSG